MSELFTREQASEWLRSNNIKDAGTLLRRFKEEMRILAECGLDDELTAFLGYPKYSPSAKTTKNSRNGHTKKILHSSLGEIPVKIPRDTNNEFIPDLIPRYCRRFPEDLEEMTFCLYGKGLTTRDISSYLTKVFHCEVSHDTISRITDEILPRAREWQKRPLEKLYPILYLDGIVFTVHQDGVITKKTAYLAYAITVTGHKDILGIWIGESESAKFWMHVLSDIKSRGVTDILIACVDGLTGFENAIAAVFPNTDVQLCIVHQVRNSAKYVSYSEKKEFCSDMKPIYQSPNKDLGKAALDDFAKKWGAKYPHAINSWYDKWNNLSNLYKYSLDIRPLIYTTNPIENINGKIRSVTKKRRIFPNNDAILKCLFLVVIEMEQKWTMPVRNWGIILAGLVVTYEERVEKYL